MNTLWSHHHARAFRAVADFYVHVKVRVDELRGELQRAVRSVLFRLPGHQALRPGRAAESAWCPDRPLPILAEGTPRPIAWTLRREANDPYSLVVCVYFPTERIMLVQRFWSSSYCGVRRYETVSPFSEGFVFCSTLLPVWSSG